MGNKEVVADGWIILFLGWIIQSETFQAPIEVSSLILIIDQMISSTLVAMRIAIALLASSILPG